jgi:hypothetical protein
VRLQDVLISYNNSVIDVRSFSKSILYKSTDTTIIKKSAPKVANKSENNQQA